MKRIEIEELGVETVNRPQRSSAVQSEVVQKITAKEEQTFDSLFTVNQSQSSTTVQTSGEKDELTKLQLSTLNSSKDHNVHKSNGLSEIPQSKTNTNPSKVSLSTTAPQTDLLEQSEAPKTSSAEKRVSKEIKSQPANPVSLSSRTTDSEHDSHCLPVPQSSFQFQSDFKLLKNKPDQFFLYFQVSSLLVLSHLTFCFCGFFLAFYIFFK